MTMKSWPQDRRSRGRHACRVGVSLSFNLITAAGTLPPADSELSHWHSPQRQPRVSPPTVSFLLGHTPSLSLSVVSLLAYKQDPTVRLGCRTCCRLARHTIRVCSRSQDSLCRLPRNCHGQSCSPGMKLTSSPSISKKICSSLVAYTSKPSSGMGFGFGA